MVSRVQTPEEEEIEKRMIFRYVFGLSYEELMRPINRNHLIDELNIDNLIVIDVVVIWIEVRRYRLRQEKTMLGRLDDVRNELESFHLDREKEAARLQAIHN